MCGVDKFIPGIDVAGTTTGMPSLDPPSELMSLPSNLQHDTFLSPHADAKAIEDRLHRWVEHDMSLGAAMSVSRPLSRGTHSCAEREPESSPTQHTPQVTGQSAFITHMNSLP